VPTLSAATIADIVHIMSALFRAATKEHPPVVLANPFAELVLPVIEPRPVEFYEPDEAAALFEAIERLSGPKCARSPNWACRWACGPVSASACTGTGSTGSAAGSRWSTS